MSASFDHVSLDQMYADTVEEDKFKPAHPDTFWQAGLEHGEKIGNNELSIGNSHLYTIGTRHQRLI